MDLAVLGIFHVSGYDRVWAVKYFRSCLCSPVLPGSLEVMSMRPEGGEGVSGAGCACIVHVHDWLGLTFGLSGPE